MEVMLQKLARQLDGLDEASLMALWSKYATLTSRFEPTKRWEEACLIFSLIQAKHFKNQLFNYCWRKEREMEGSPAWPSAPPEPAGANFDIEPQAERSGCRILSFTPAQDAPSTPEEEGH